VIAILATNILAQKDLWRKGNERKNRYEGRIDIPVGKPELELLSFTGYRESFAGDVLLKVRFFLPTASPVFIHGRELREQKQYWMESKPAEWQAGKWNEFYPWPTREVINREGIPSSNLGILVRLKKKTVDCRNVAPAFLYHSTLPASVKTYAIHLRPYSNLKKVTYTLYKIINDQEVKVKTDSLHGNLIAGEPFLIKLEVRGLPENLLRLVIQGVYKNKSGGPHLEYKFYHKPQIR
jgi:hypothetical protein